MEHNWEKYFDTESDYWKKVQVIYEENEHYPKVVVSDRNLHHKFLRALSKKEGVDVDNDPDNLVSLSLPDHLRVHYYLYKCTKKGFRNITGFPVRFMLKKAIGSISDKTFEMVAKDYDVFHLKHSEESRKKMSKARKGKKLPPLSEEAKRKISEAKKGHKKPEGAGKQPKRVLCVETGEVFPSTHEAERQTGINTGHISKVCSGKRETTGGFHWKFV